MSLTMQAVTIDCDDVAAQAEFWSAALSLPVDDHDGNAFMRTINGASASLPRLMLLKVPEAKSVKNRMHLDLTTDDRESEITRLEGLGATRIRDHHEWGFSWTVLTDPEGNEFCVADAAGH